MFFLLAFIILSTDLTLCELASALRVQLLARWDVVGGFWNYLTNCGDREPC